MASVIADAVIALFPRPAANGWTRLSFHALQEPRSWIWLPRSIVVEGRGPDSVWRRVATLTHDVDERANLAHPFEVDLTDAGPLTGLRLAVDALDGQHAIRRRRQDLADRPQQRRNPDLRPLPTPDRIVKAEVLRKREHPYVPKKVGDVPAEKPGNMTGVSRRLLM